MGYIFNISINDKEHVHTYDIYIRNPPEITFARHEDVHIIEWGEVFNNEEYFVIDENFTDQDINVKYIYDENNIGKVQNLSIVVDIKDSQYINTCKIIVTDTSPPYIEYNGMLEVRQFSDYSPKDFIDVYDIKGESNAFFIHEEILVPDKANYTYTVSNVNMLYSELDTSKLGFHSVQIIASDGNGNFTTEEININVVL